MEDYSQYILKIVEAAVVTGTAAIAASLYYFYTFYLFFALPPPTICAVDLNNQSKQLRGPERIRCSRFYPDGKLLEFMHDDVRTLHDIFYRGLRKSNDGPCMGWKAGKNAPYKFISYSTAIQRFKNFAAGLVHSGVVPGQSTYIGIYSQNCAEWVIAEQACYYISSIVVPLYDTLGPNACSYIINQAEIEFVICDKEARVKSLLTEKESVPKLKTIIVMQELSEEVLKKAKEVDVNILFFKDVENTGKEHPCEPIKPSSSDLCTVCYTSGTTGNPKGVMLTHGNIIICVSGILLQCGIHGPIPTDVMISYLPLAHMLERTVQAGGYLCGCTIGFSQGDTRLLIDDIKELKPTFIPMVPRLLNRIYDKVQNGATGSLMKKWIMDMALKSKKSLLEKHIITNRSIWDKFVFKQIQESLGGRLRIIVSGAAPLASNIRTFLRCALGCEIIEAYGQTECSGPCAVTLFGDTSDSSHVGPPLACNHVKLVDVPEMEYFACNDEGEVCVKGGHVFKGYLKEPEKTAETLDEDGWLHTGDIGKWLENGTLRIIDRKKNIFKLSQGEYIAPEKIENVYLSSPYVSQIFVYGESIQTCLVAVVVPDTGAVTKWCESNNISFSNWEEIRKKQAVKKMLKDNIVDLGKKAGLKSFEQVKDIYVSPTPFTLENGLLTPTLKTKRVECRKFFKPQIDSMYKSLA